MTVVIVFFAFADYRFGSATNIPEVVFFAVNIAVATEATELGVQLLRTLAAPQTRAMPRPIGGHQIESVNGVYNISYEFRVWLDHESTGSFFC